MLIFQHEEGFSRNLSLQVEEEPSFLLLYYFPLLDSYLYSNVKVLFVLFW